MSRRVSKVAVTIFALTLTLSAPSVFAARPGPTFEDPSSGVIERVVRVFRKAVKKLTTGTVSHDEPTYTPRPPLP